MNSNVYSEEPTYSKDICSLMRRTNALEDGLFFLDKDSRHSIPLVDLWDGVTATDYRNRGAVWDSAGNLYITGSLILTSTGVLKKFSSDYELIWTKTITSAYSGAPAKGPGNILIDASDNIIIVWSYCNAIQIYDTDGNFVREFLAGAYNGGIPPTELFVTGNAALGPDGLIYAIMGHGEGLFTGGSYTWVGVWDVFGNKQREFTLGDFSIPEPTYSFELHRWRDISIKENGNLVFVYYVERYVGHTYFYNWDEWTSTGVLVKRVPLSLDFGSSVGHRAPIVVNSKYVEMIPTGQVTSIYNWGVFSLDAVPESSFGQGEVFVNSLWFSANPGFSYFAEVSAGVIRVVMLTFATTPVEGHPIAIEIADFKLDQTEFEGYTKNEAGTLDGVSLGTPDAGASVPENNALVDYDFVRKPIFDLHEAVDRLARYFICSDNSVGFFRWVRFYYETDGLHFTTDGLSPDIALTGFVPDNLDEILYYVSLENVLADYGLTGAAADYYAWRPVPAFNPGISYDFDPGEIHECLTFLESATLLGDLS